jgi:flavin reductase (DIM6/NTAB) family NADH-FMN oxidoreductase RutF
MIILEALFKVSYGLYIVSSGNKEKGNGFISNTVFQVTAEPARFAACCNKNNYTAELIEKTGAFAVSVLHKDTAAEIFGRFGYKSGRDTDKLAEMSIEYSESGVPIILNDCIAWMEFKLIQTIDVGTHFLYIGELVHSAVIDDTKEPLNYLYYRQVRKGVAPKNAPTYIDKSKLESSIRKAPAKKYKCGACGFIYDDATEKIKFADLPDSWVCPVCGSEKDDFIEINQ